MALYKPLQDTDLVEKLEDQSTRFLQKYCSSDSLLSRSPDSGMPSSPISPKVINAMLALRASSSGYQLTVGWRHWFSQLDPDDLLLIQQCGQAVSKLTESDWALKHTACYWVSIMFIIGSVLFTSGSWFWLYDLNYTQQLALVDWPFFIGSIAFNVGAYISWWQTMNLKSPPPPQTIYWSFKDRDLSWWICWWYVLGTVMYYGNTLSAVGAIPLPPSWANFPWFMGFFGGVGFTLGGACEMISTKFWKCRPYKLSWWVAYLDFIGGFLFAFAAMTGFWSEVSSTCYKVTKISYLVGSLFYVFGSTLELVMWKSEQFGLAYMPTLNLTDPINKRGTVSIVQLPFIFLYCCTAAISVTGITYSYCSSGYWIDMSGFILGLFIPAGVLSLTSVIHREPEEPPFSYLLWFLRIVMVWLTMNHLIDCFKLNQGEFPRCNIN